jgi:hypothetical protein
MGCLTKVAINGLGANRPISVQVDSRGAGVRVEPVNDLVEVENLAYLLRFDAA